MIQQTMEGHNQEERHICKFCNKICLTGRSLGGHMRGHLNLISAAKNGKIKSLRNLGFEENDQNLGFEENDQNLGFQENVQNLSKKTEQDEESLNQEKFFKNREGVENGYVLRGRKPKKSWKFSPELKKNSERIKNCKECGKGFSSVRALSGHMRCHPVRKRERFFCNFCEKDFDSMKGLFGHMKCHPKSEQKEGLAELTTLCPVKKKRSTIRYKINNNSQSFQFSCLDACSSSSLVSKTEEYENAVMCLMMLSRGVRNWDSVVFDAGSFGNHLNVIPNVVVDEDDDNGGEFDDDDVSEKMDIDWEEQLDTEYFLNVKTLSQEVKRNPAVDFQENSVWEVPVDAIMSRENFKKLKYDASEASDVEMDTDNRETADSAEAHLGLKLDDPDYSEELPEQGAVNLKAVNSFGTQKSKENLFPQESVKMREVTSFGTKKSKEHQCPECFKIFPSGQALGGHKRAHYAGVNERKANGSLRKNQELSEIHEFPLDLDVIGGGGGIRNDHWWTGKSSEALMMSH